MVLLDPEEVGLRELGDHRLKDLAAPVVLHQLGDEDFPPLKTLHRTTCPCRRHRSSDARRSSPSSSLTRIRAGRSRSDAYRPGWHRQDPAIAPARGGDRRRLPRTASGGCRSHPCARAPWSHRPWRAHSTSRKSTTHSRRVDRELAGAQASASADRQLRAPRRPGRDARCGGCEREPGGSRHGHEPRGAGGCGRAHLSGRAARRRRRDRALRRACACRRGTPRPGEDDGRGRGALRHGSTISRLRWSSLRPEQRFFPPPPSSRGCPRASTSSPVPATQTSANARCGRRSRGATTCSKSASGVSSVASASSSAQPRCPRSRACAKRISATFSRSCPRASFVRPSSRATSRGTSCSRRSGSSRPRSSSRPEISNTCACGT